MEGRSVAGSGEQGLGLSGTGKESPEEVFDLARGPRLVAEAERLAGFGIGIDDPTDTFEKDQDGQGVKHLSLGSGIRIFR
jgi:hypothetical protein